MVSSIPDFTRYARKPSDTYIQVIIIPVMFTVVGFFGIAVTSAGAVLCKSAKYDRNCILNFVIDDGQYFWNPLQLIDNWDNRAATFFVAFSFALATL